MDFISLTSSMHNVFFCEKKQVSQSVHGLLAHGLLFEEAHTCIYIYTYAPHASWVRT